MYHYFDDERPEKEVQLVLKDWIEKEIACNDRMMAEVEDVLGEPDLDLCSKVLKMMEAGHEKKVNEYLVGCGYEPYYK